MIASAVVRFQAAVGGHLTTRQAVVSVVGSLLCEVTSTEATFSKVESLVFDLSQVSFVSRSAADQLLKEQERISRELAVPVEITNQEPQVQAMLELVNRTRYASAPPLRMVAVETLSDLEQVEQRWLSIA